MFTVIMKIATFMTCMHGDTSGRGKAFDESLSYRGQVIS